MTAVPEDRRGGVPQQRMRAARLESRVGPVQLQPHHPFFDLFRIRPVPVSLPGRGGLTDQFLQAAGYRPQDRLLQQGGHQQVTVTFQRIPLPDA